jgi:anti-sigma regulatory factor (Ser/Thr protein kinase)
MQLDFTINIRDNNVLHGLQEVMRIIDALNQSSDSHDVISFDNRSFVTPLFVLPLIVYLKGLSKVVHLDCTSSYMSAISLAEGGIRPDTMSIDQFVRKLSPYSKKTFLPIINFPTSISTSKERASIIETTEKILINQLKLELNIILGLKYIISESIDNIIEHSESDRGYIMCQAYPYKGYLDVCIADHGISLLNSYIKNSFKNITSHLSAMRAANQGISTKNLPDNENRGYGIQTSKNMLVKGLSGNFIMLSGDVVYLYSNDQELFLSLPNNISFQGTIMALRIPFVNKTFNYLQFVE